MERVTIDARAVVALTRVKDEAKALWKLQLSALKESAHPFARKVEQLYFGEVKAKGSKKRVTTVKVYKGKTSIITSRKKIGIPQIYYKGIKEDKNSGLPVLFMMPANNGFHWFDSGTAERYTKSRRSVSGFVQLGNKRKRITVRSGRGGYRGQIKPLNIFRRAYTSTASEVGGNIEASMTKIVDKAIQTALKRYNKTGNI